MRETNHETEIMEERINGLNEQLNARENRDAKIKQHEKTVDETQDNINNLMEKIDEKKNVGEKSCITNKDSTKIDQTNY